MYSLACSIVNDKMMAEDVTQEAFIKAYQSLGKFEGRSRFSTWLYKITTNEALKRVKKKFPEKKVDSEDISDSQSIEINSSVSAMAEEEQRYYINKTMDSLSLNDSMVLKLFYLNECSLKDIREVTGMSETNIKTILHRARKRFYTILKNQLKDELKHIL